MTLYILFGVEGSGAMPDPLLIWSEYQREDNEEKFQEEVRGMKDRWGKDYFAIQLVEIEVPGAVIADVMLRKIVVQGQVEV